MKNTIKEVESRLEENLSKLRSPEYKSLEAVKGCLDPVADLVRSLDRAESKPGYDFVALKWFRDAYLPTEKFEWAASDSAKQAALRQAIDRRLILTSKVQNPKSPQFRVTAIRLNRLLPDVQTMLGTGAVPDSGFDPVDIRGERLSATVLRERR